ncbi:SOS response-associated peptidase family protein [Sphingomonas sp. RHCKR47]|uniref:SOS response-associated peptidase family protein n=1 Tax=Sphingomonas citricola TaxID=2862498 RepID=UPI001CA5F37D|nr:SOS response-associated peptidase family protein [Sphingomonas citricola]MBW6522108.1 SOS response-associated peptidase family protein [Sphingomonas citricola]
MCNEAARRIELGLLREDFHHLRIPLRFPEGLPNMAPLASIRITDPTVIVRASADTPGEAELVTRRWSWPGTHGRPVYNYRSDGRNIARGRCLIPVDGFYEFTAPTDPGQKRKTKWLFTHAREPWFCIAGVWRDDAAVGQAFAMLTTRPGADIAPYHDRQVVVLDRSDWRGWLDGSAASGDLCRPAPPGTLVATRVDGTPAPPGG